MIQKKQRNQGNNSICETYIGKKVEERFTTYVVFVDLEKMFHLCRMDKNVGNRN